MTDGPGERSEATEKAGSLDRQVEKLRILEEANAHTIKLIAEGHGAKLDSIIKALAPLQEIRDFVECVADDHEGRIAAMEKHTGISH